MNPPGVLEVNWLYAKLEVKGGRQAEPAVGGVVKWFSPQCRLAKLKNVRWGRLEAFLARVCVPVVEDVIAGRAKTRGSPPVFRWLNGNAKVRFIGHLALFLNSLRCLQGRIASANVAKIDSLILALFVVHRS